MIDTWKLLLASRKFWVGFLTIVCVTSAVVLRALDKIPADALMPTIAAMAGTGMSIIGSIAWEDSAAKKAAGPAPAPLQTVNVATTTEEKKADGSD